MIGVPTREISFPSNILSGKQIHRRLKENI
jgi:hypothetical protein